MKYSPLNPHKSLRLIQFGSVCKQTGPLRQLQRFCKTILELVFVVYIYNFYNKCGCAQYEAYGITSLMLEVHKAGFRREVIL